MPTPKKIVSILFIFTLLMITSLNLNSYHSAMQGLMSDQTLGTRDAPLDIDGNAQLAACAMEGDGSANTPYILKNYRIDAIGQNKHGIYIRNTTAYFILQNCTVLQTDSGRMAILLENVTHGTVLNNTLQQSDVGVCLRRSSNNSVIRNIAINEYLTGISLLEYSNNNTIVNNTANGNGLDGITVDSYCTLNKILNNTLNNNGQYGVWLTNFCSNNTLSGNTANSNRVGFAIYTDFNIVSHNTANYNLNNEMTGIALYGNSNLVNNNTIIGNSEGIYAETSLKNIIANNTIINNTGDGIFFYVNANNNSVTNNLLDGNGYGIFVVVCNFTKLSNNIVKNSGWWGIILDVRCSFNCLMNNSAYNNGYSGIYISDSNANNITGNFVVGNHFYGIEVTGDENYFYGNIVTGNTPSDIVDSGVGNIWIPPLKTSFFEWNPPINLATGADPHSVFIGDANNDGQNDLVTADSGPDRISIFLWNTTAGTWNAPLSLATGYSPQSVFIGDANNDGQNDLVTADKDSDRISIFLWNTTAGNWSAVQTLTTGDDPRAVFIGDANNDGQNDLVTADGYANSISIFLWNTTAGTWGARQPLTTGNGPNSICIGDANNDGQQDIVTSGGSSISIHLWNTTKGTWDARLSPASGNGGYSVLIRDANNDGQQDIVTTSTFTDRISIFLWNTTAGNWSAPLSLATGKRPFSVFIGDANNDGQQDLVSADRDDSMLSIFLWNTTAGNWSAPIRRVTGSFPLSVFIGDANNDGQQDLVTANLYSDTVSVLLWNITAGAWGALQTKTTSAGSYSVFIGDANNDGQQDLVTVNAIVDKTSIFLWNRITGTWNAPQTLTTGDYPRSVFIGDANNDGQNDIVTADSYSNRISIFLWNRLTGTWSAPQTQTTGANPASVFIGDANNDGQNDIVTANSNVNSISIFLWNMTAGTWRAPITRTTGANPASVFIGDANNDGQNDIVTAGSNLISIHLWNMTAGNWSAPLNWATGSNPWSVFIGDANNDGQNDLVTADMGSSAVSIFLWNTTAGNWNARQTLTTAGSPLSVFIGDANNDGQQDIVTGDFTSNTISIFLWNMTAGTWNPRLNRATGSVSWSVFIGDANNDGQNDIVTGNYEGVGSSTLSILLWVNAPGDAPVIDSISQNPDYDGQIQINWSKVERATTYALYRDIIPISSVSSLTPIANIPSNTYIDTVAKNGIYYYAVVPRNAGGLGPISNYVNVTVRIPLPAPALIPILPAIVQDGVVELNWSDVIYATSYYIYCATTPISDVEGLIPFAQVSESNYTTILSTNGIYQWVIVASDGWVNSSISNCENVTVAIPPVSPTLNQIQPRFDLDGIIELNWSEVISATRYYIYQSSTPISTVSGMTPIAMESDTNYTESLSTNGLYYWVIIASDGWANSSISNCENVTVAKPLAPPDLSQIQPRIDADGIISLNWSEITAVNRYYIYHSNTTISTISGMSPIAMVSDSNYTALLPNGIHYWVIVASDSWVNSSISNCENVTVAKPLAPPVLSQIQPRIDADGIICLNWSDVITAIRYYVYQSTTLILTITGMTPIAMVADSNYTASLSTNGLYYWVIVASDGWANGSISNCENVVVGIPINSPLLYPIIIDVNNNGIVYINWEDMEGATLYYIYRATTNLTSITGRKPIAYIAWPTYFMDIIPLNKTYYYVIVASDGWVNSSISNCECVQITIPSEPPITAPESPLLASISPNPNEDGFIYLQWSNVADASFYYLYRSTANITTVAALTPIAIISGTMYFIDLVDSSDIYYYVIVAGNGGGNSSLSNCESVEVIILLLVPPLSPVLAPIIPNSDSAGIIYLDWNDVNGATTYYIYRSTSPISSVPSLPPVAIVSGYSYFIDFIDTEGIYYYGIVAGNNLGNSSISNSKSITVSFAQDGGGDQDFLLEIAILVGSVAIAAAIIVYGFLRRSRPVAAPPTSRKQALAKSNPQSEVHEKATP